MVVTRTGSPRKVDRMENRLARIETIQEAVLATSPQASRYRCTVLLVDDEPAVLKLLETQLGQEFDTVLACSAHEAQKLFDTRTVDIVLTDLQLKDVSGIQLLEWVHRHHPHVGRVLLTGTARVQDAVEAINNCRIHRIVLKPWRSDDIQTILRAVARTLLLERSHEHLLDEYRRLNQELENRVQSRTKDLENALNQLQLKNQILEKMALTDALTGLPNRRAIDLIARKELLRRSRFAMPLAIGLIDADRFKSINTHYLLSGGDHVLAWLAQVLQGAMRQTDAIGRIGGEEFMVVAPNTETDGAEILAERLRTTVESGSTIYRDQTIRLTVSVGVAVSPCGVNATYEQLREVAGAALVEAKRTRNTAIVKILGT
jgi:diguanylate cyclase